jgi:hypothetical protein
VLATSVQHANLIERRCNGRFISFVAVPNRGECPRTGDSIMRRNELDHLLKKAVADALGLSLPPVANSHHRAYGKPHPTYARKHPKPVVISTRHERVRTHAHA